MRIKKRARTAIRSNGEHWPEDMVTEILLRLPVKSILRFKCVATTWYNLIKNPIFVSQHLAFTKKKTLLVCYSLHICDSNDCGLDHPNGMGLFDVDGLPLQRPHHLAFRYVSNICVDNGLVCLRDGLSLEITIWNPATREFRILPQTPQYNLNLEENEKLIDVPFFGFGLDPVSNDYKMISIYLYFTTTVGHIKCCTVYTMSTNSWRVMKGEDVEMIRDRLIIEYPLKASCACVNGVYYWQLGTKLSPTSPSIPKLLAFHFGDQTFQLIEPPLSTYGELLRPFDNYGRVCFCCSDDASSTTVSDFRRSNYAMWMLNDEGQWTKLFRIDNPQRFTRVFNFVEERKVLILSSQSKLSVYDIDAKEYRNLGLVRANRRLFHAYPYQESVVVIGS